MGLKKVDLRPNKLKLMQAEFEKLDEQIHEQQEYKIPVGRLRGGPNDLEAENELNEIDILAYRCQIKLSANAMRSLLLKAGGNSGFIKLVDFAEQVAYDFSHKSDGNGMNDSTDGISAHDVVSKP